MANEESILREVNQELAEDRQSEILRKYVPAFVGAGAAIVIGVAGWQFWNAREDATAKAQALEFDAALELLAEDQDAGRAALGAVAEDGGGYGVLAELQRAASFARGGERLRAIELYRSVYGNSGVAPQLRDFARLRAAYMSLVDGRDAVLNDLGDLTESEGAYGVYAREVAALAALGAEDYETAQSMFRQLSIDIAAPQAVRTRAEDMAALAAAGKAGVNITGEARVDDLIRAVGEAAPDAPSPQTLAGDEDAAATQEQPAPAPEAAAAEDAENAPRDPSEDPSEDAPQDDSETN